MKVLNKPIDVITYHTKEGDIIPIKFRIEEEDMKYTVKIKVISKEKYKECGKLFIRFNCQGIINNTEKRYELNLDILNCIWTLYKI